MASSAILRDHFDVPKFRLDTVAAKKQFPTLVSRSAEPQFHENDCKIIEAGAFSEPVLCTCNMVVVIVDPCWNSQIFRNYIGEGAWSVVEGFEKFNRAGLCVDDGWQTDPDLRYFIE